MKTKLTLSIDAALVPRAKAQARRRGSSLSSLVEDALRDLTDDEQPSIVDRWTGRFTLSERGGSRYDALVRKYLDRPGTDLDDTC